MKKFFLFALLCAATSLFAEIKVEDFTIKNGGTTSTYVTSLTSRECTQATWSFISGGLRTDVGNFSTCAAVIRAKKNGEEIYPYFESSTISGGIDSLWMTWNSNGNESGTWNIKVYINNVLIGSMTETAGSKDATPTKKFGIGQLKTTGDFTIKIVNESAYSGTDNRLRFVFDDLSWTTYAPGEKTTPVFAFAADNVRKAIGDEAFTNALTNSSDATPSFESSNTEVATIAQDGKVTIAGVGYTTISASIAETENFKAAEASYTLRVVPANWKIETFDKITMACIVNPSANANTCSQEPVTDELDNGVSWTYWLGGANDAVFGNRAMYIRARLSTESAYDYGYVKSSEISGGISRLAFKWNQGGVESITYKVLVKINGETVGVIDSVGKNPTYSKPIDFEVKDLKIEGKFTIEIINETPFDGTGNKGRIVINDLEWEGYEAPHIYSVAGAEALLGSNWNEKEGNELELQDDGKYKLVLENVELAKGNYEYKVVIDHKWNNGEVQENSVLSIDKSGIYDVTFTYDAAIPEVSAVADLKEEVVILPSVQLKGGFNGWEGEDLVPAEDKKSCSITRTIAQGDWSFKMYVNSQWLGEGQEITRENNTATATLDGADMTLKADKGGDYTFTWTYETNTLVVTFPAEDLPVEHIYSLAGSVGLFGVNWDPLGDFEMTKQDDGSYKYVMTDKELAKATYEFKVVIDHQWNNGEVADNSQLVIDKAGKYDITFTYVPDTKATAATAELKEELIIIPTVQLAGQFNSWNAEDLTAAEDKLTCSISKSLEAGEYTFKMIVAGSWLGGTQEFTRANNTYVVDANGDDMKLVADRTGEYTFTWTYETNTLEITFPAAPKFKIAGSMSDNWTASIESFEDSYTFENLEAGNHMFKVVDGDAWIGFSALTEADKAVELYTDQNDNVCFTLAEAGDVVVTYIKDQVFKVEGNFVLPTVQIIGIKGWVAETDAITLTAAEDKLTASATLHFEEWYYEFKMIVAGAWLGKENGESKYELHSGWTSVDGLTYEGENIILRLGDGDKVPGDYKFVWTYATGKLEVIFPSTDPTGIENTEAGAKVQKMIENGQIVIIRNGEKFNAQGQVIR